MLGANTLWGLMSPLSKFVMAAGYAHIGHHEWGDDTGRHDKF